MTFIIVLIALAMERFFHWHHVRQWDWFYHYEKWLNEHTLRWADSWRLLISVGLPVLLVGVVSYLLKGWGYGIFQLLFGVLVLLYCLGPENIWMQVYQLITEMHQKSPEDVAQFAKKQFGVAVLNNPQLFHKAIVRAIFENAHQSIFAVLFWFVTLGPMGAVLYRLVVLFTERQALGLVAVATSFKKILDWLPIRIFTFIFALGGHFTEVMVYWKQGIKQGVEANDSLLTDCAIAALDVMEGDKIPENGDAEMEAIELLDRVLVMALVLLALIVMVI